MSICRSSSSISRSPGLLHHRRDLDPGERRLAAVRGVERRQAHEPVHALLGRVEPVGVLARGPEGGRLDPRLLPRARLEQLDREAAALGPAHQHAQDHLRPVLRVGPAGAGVDRDQRVAVVIGAGEQPLLLERLEPLLDRGDRGLELGSHLVVLLGELGEPSEVLDVRRQRLVALQAAVDARVLGADLAGRLRVVPEARPAHLLLELGPALLQPCWVKDSPRGARAARGSPQDAAASAAM